MRQQAKFQVVGVERHAVYIADVGPHHVYQTVTNAAEWVVAQLVQSELLPPGRRLFYYDSEGELTEILLDAQQRFAGFAFVPQESHA